jgi:hypothetical protein
MCFPKENWFVSNNFKVLPKQLLLWLSSEVLGKLYGRKAII